MANQDDAGRAFEQAAAIMARLRAPGGCPWDREQTFDTIRRYTLEETYEVFDAIERRDWNDLREELGDLLLQVLFYAQMAQEDGHFNITGVIETLNEKLVRRHPHVFGELAGQGLAAERVLSNWEKFKQEERAAKTARSGTPQSLLDDVPRGMPATLEAQKLGAKAARVHFDWPDVQGLFDKLEEETHELREELRQKERNPERVASEAGDLLFTAVQIARRCDVDAEMALRGTNARFRRRFRAMEQAAAQRGRQLQDLSPDEMETLWAEAKSADKREDPSS